jgi:CDP-diglyceride synthetase
MLAKRAASASVIIFFGFLLALAGGWIYSIGVALILSIATWEYATMFRKGGYFPAFFLNICIFDCNYRPL